jgi:hypothetical protein
MTEDDTQPLEATAPPVLGGPLLLSDVYLLTADSEGRIAVPGLTVLLDESGLTVRKPDGEIGAIVAWADVTTLVASMRMRTPAGSQGVVVEVVTPSRTHRFVVPTDDPLGLESMITHLADAVGTRGTRRVAGKKRLSGVLVGALTVVIVAGIALAVLVGIGTVKF